MSLKVANTCQDATLREARCLKSRPRRSFLHFCGAELLEDLRFRMLYTAFESLRSPIIVSRQAAVPAKSAGCPVAVAAPPAEAAGSPAKGKLPLSWLPWSREALVTAKSSA